MMYIKINNDMLTTLLPPRYKHILGLVLIISSALTLYVLSATSRSTAYDLPNDALIDYTSHAAICACPSNDDERKNQLFNTGRLKSWFPYYPSAKKPNVSVSNQAKVPCHAGFTADVIPVARIERYMLSHLEQLQEAYNATHDLALYALNLGNISLPIYIKELLSTYHTYLEPQHRTPTYLPPLLSRLSLRPPIAPLPPRPKIVMTTEKSISDLPSEFERWKEIMPEWDVRYFDDKALKRWVGEAFEGSGIERVWKRLPRTVLQTDLFRYTWVHKRRGCCD